MKSSNVLGYAAVAALATGAVVIGQSQPGSAQPGQTRPATVQPGQPGAQPRTGDQTRWRDYAERTQRMSERMKERNERLTQQLVQAQLQTGEARVNALAEVLSGLLQEHEYLSREIARLQRMTFRSYFDMNNMSQEWDTWKQQYPFLDETRDRDDADTGSDVNRRPIDSGRPTTTPGTPTPRPGETPPR